MTRHSLHIAFRRQHNARRLERRTAFDRVHLVAEALVTAAMGVMLFAAPGWPALVTNRLKRDTDIIRNFHTYRDRAPPDFDPSLTVLRTPDGDVFWFRPSVGPAVSGVVNYLRANLAPGDRFFCYPYATRYYFLLGQTSLGTFGPGIWSGAARPRDQQRLVEMLTAEQPKYVIYDESEWPDTDGVSWMDRAPLPTRYIFENYHLETRIGPVQILRLGKSAEETPSKLMIADLSQQRYLIRGWYHPEILGTPGRWSTTHATAKLKCPSRNQDFYLRVSLVSATDRILSLNIDDRPILNANLAGLVGDQTFAAPVPREFQGQDVQIDLRVSSALKVPDLRSLGVWVTELGFRSAAPPVWIGKRIVGRGPDAVLEFEYTDADGPDDIASSEFIVSSVLDGAHACYVSYTTHVNAIALAEDVGTLWSPAVATGSSEKLENSQCVVDTSRSAAVRDGTRMKLKVAIHFKAAFAGRKQIFTRARDKHGRQSAEWSAAGMWDATP